VVRMLTKKQLKEAARCCGGICELCSCNKTRMAYPDCIREAAKTALAYREMLRKIQFSATQVYDNDHIAEYCCPICGGQGYHEVDCELAKLLESEVKHDA
jgi:hypothetical protein